MDEDSEGGRAREGFFLSGNVRAAYRISSEDCFDAECVIWISVSETGIPEILSSSLQCGVWSVVEEGGSTNSLIGKPQSRTGEQSTVIGPKSQGCRVFRNPMDKLLVSRSELRYCLLLIILTGKVRPLNWMNSVPEESW